MAVSGPLARSIADLRLALAAMSAPDARDPWWTPAPLNGPDFPRRAALSVAPDGMPVVPEVAAALQDAAGRLRAAGWTVEEVVPPPPPAPPPLTAEFDGRYTGTIRVSGASTSMDPKLCETSPQISFTVRDGQFNLAIPPLKGGFAQSIVAAVDTTYGATVRADGSITGLAERSGATLKGRAEGNAVRGEAFGLLCYYAFAATRR